MRSEGNPLDLNNLPDDYNSRDHGKHHQLLDDPSSGGGYRKKKSGGGGNNNNNNNNNKEECGKVYECRFCSLKFCKSQALGGHMNRHRQERETETLNRARQLVFSNDNLAAQSHLSCCHPITPAGSGYHHQAPAADPTMPLRFPTRMFSSSPSAYVPPPPPHPPPQPYVYTPPRPFSPHYPPPSMAAVNDHYYLGHVLGGSNNPSVNYGAGESNYTCIGAPVGFGRGNTAAEMAESGGCGSSGSLL